MTKKTDIKYITKYITLAEALNRGYNIIILTPLGVPVCVTEVIKKPESK